MRIEGIEACKIIRMADSHTTARKNTMNCVPEDLLNDLSSRFIINVPEEERSDLVRLCFQIELAHWFYLDFYCDEDATLPRTTLNQFIKIIFRHIPFLRKYDQAEVDRVIAEWREYKQAVPTYGAILLDEDLKKVLLVQSFVSRASWGFPKGKVNEGEKSSDCAIREVLEETGFDITDLLNEKEFVEYHFNDQLIRLYIIPGVPATAEFRPRTRKEIKDAKWFAIQDLPSLKRDLNSQKSDSDCKFFIVAPFMKPLKKWIHQKGSSYIKDKPSRPSESTPNVDQELVKQQLLFTQLTQSNIANYAEARKSKLRPHKASSVTPPPRTTKQNSQRHTPERKKASEEEKKCMPLNARKKIYNSSSYDTSPDGLETNYYVSPTWKNFKIDREALIATFNISMRKNLEAMRARRLHS